MEPTDVLPAIGQRTVHVYILGYAPTHSMQSFFHLQLCFLSVLSPFCRLPVSGCPFDFCVLHCLLQGFHVVSPPCQPPCIFFFLEHVTCTHSPLPSPWLPSIGNQASRFSPIVCNLTVMLPLAIGGGKFSPRLLCTPATAAMICVCAVQTQPVMFAGRSFHPQCMTLRLE